MAEYRVLVVTNLWPTEADQGYGAAIQAQMEMLRYHGVDYEVLFVNGRESTMNYVRGIFDVRRRVVTKKYDLIYAHFGLSGWVARFQKRVPVVVKFMGDDVLGQFDGRGRLTLAGRIFQISSRVLARHIEGSIVMSGQMKRKLGLETAAIVPTGVNLDLFKPMDQTEARRALGLEVAKKFVLFPYGSDRPAKRLDLVEQAVGQARAEFPELEILQISGAAQQELPIYFNAADVFVLASESEGSPNAVKEALAVNLPVITVDVGDAADVIRGVEGNYVVQRNAEAIAERLIEVCRRGGRTRGRERAEQFSLSAMARKVVEVFEGVAERA